MMNWFTQLTDTNIIAIIAIVVPTVLAIIGWIIFSRKSIQQNSTINGDGNTVNQSNDSGDNKTVINRPNIRRK
jgi:hypothetical protein